MKKACILIVILIYSPIFAQADELEAGFGVSTVVIPDYLGSKSYQTYYVPFPYIRYTSDKIKVDRNLIRTDFFKSGNWHGNVSFGGSLPARSSKNTPRDGMPDLNFLIEAGPALQYYFTGTLDSENALYIDLPLRMAIESDFSFFERQGLTFNPSVIWRRGYRFKQFWLRPQLTFALRAADETYHQYIYGVERRYQTQERSSYDASGGYGGWRASYSTSFKWNDRLLAFGFTYLNIDGATFSDSPLVETESNWFGGIAYAWLF